MMPRPEPLSRVRGNRNRTRAEVQAVFGKHVPLAWWAVFRLLTGLHNLAQAAVENLAVYRIRALRRALKRRPMEPL